MKGFVKIESIGFFLWIGRSVDNLNAGKCKDSSFELNFIFLVSLLGSIGEFYYYGFFSSSISYSFD